MWEIRKRERAWLRTQMGRERERERELSIGRRRRGEKMIKMPQISEISNVYKEIKGWDLIT